MNMYRSAAYALPLLFLAIGFAPNAFATTYRTNTVDGLIHLLTTYNGKSHVIELEPGDYQLRDSDCMNDDASIGPSHLYGNAITICGTGAKPEDTRLIGSGTRRLIQLASSAGVLKNLTITNGYAKTVKGKSSSDRGGGTYNGTLRNCLLIGNKADAYGGASGGGYNAYDCRYFNNSCPRGGALHGGSVYTSVISNNYSKTEGGAGYNVSLIDGCAVIGNRSDGSIGAISMCATITNSLIACNVSKGDTGAVYLYCSTNASGFGTFNLCVDSVISNNTSGALTGGIVSRTKVVDIDGNSVKAVVRRCTIIGNEAQTYGGGINYCLCEDCLITNNVAQSGGGAYQSVLRNCRVIGNSARSGFGGIRDCKAFDSSISFNRSCGDSCGACGGGSVISNCVVYANIASNELVNCYGPALMSSTAYDSEICGNYCFGVGTNKTGGAVSGCVAGAHNSTLYRCYVHDNYSKNFAGGLRDSSAYNCLISNNLGDGTGPNSLGAKYYDCVVEGMGVYGGLAVRTVFRNIGQMVTPACPHATYTRMSSKVIEGGASLTNCLFTGNVFRKDGDNVTAGCIFSSYVDAPSRIVNCTVVSNTVRTVFTAFSAANKTATVVNSLFFGNGFDNKGTWVDSDIGATDKCAPAYLSFSHCAYGTSAVSTFGPFITDVCYKFGASDGADKVTVLGAETPAFCLGRDAEHPYALRHCSKARRLGVKQDWMETATDIRGEGYARLRDGKVDLGCYQCWLDPVGSLLLVR